MDIRGGRRSSNIEDRRGMRVGRTGAGLSLGGVVFLLRAERCSASTRCRSSAWRRRSAQVRDAARRPAVPGVGRGSAVLRDLADGGARRNRGDLGPALRRPVHAGRRWCCTPRRRNPTAARARRRWARSTARRTSRCTSTSRSSTTWQQRFGAGGDFALGVRDRARGRPPRAEPAGHGRHRSTAAQQSAARPKRTSCRCAWSCRPTATPASGRTTRRRACRSPTQDIDEALAAANAIGDDRLQRQSQGVVVPDSFTHGSSEQRRRWLQVGMESGDPRACDTFNARQL